MVLKKVGLKIIQGDPDAGIELGQTASQVLFFNELPKDSGLGFVLGAQRLFLFPVYFVIKMKIPTKICSLSRLKM